MTKISVPLQLLPHAQGLELPAYQTRQAAGFDVRAAIGENDPVILPPGGYQMIPTGLAMELPEGYEAQVRPRSGLAAKNGVTVLNAPGTIDADYRGEVKVILINHGLDPFQVDRGMRIAQIVIQKVTQVEFSLAASLTDSERADGGFGSTGTA